MKKIESLISLAIKEDIGSGDHSGKSCIPEDATGKAKLLAKDEGIIAGLEVALEVFRQTDPNLKVEFYYKDGDAIQHGDVVLTLSGNSQAILRAERLALNFMQRMSGIATHTHNLVQKIKDLNTKILDTRKTTPNSRVFEKMAVKIGGGLNHRMGLYDMIMIKDNHIDYAGGIAQAINKAKDYLKENNLDIPIEVEARNLQEVREILAAPKVERIMLDNFNYENLKTAVELIGNRSETEASGGITSETIRDYALCGVDFISVGALTHQVKSLDLSLKAF